MVLQGDRGATDQLSSRVDYRYRRAGSSDWQPLGSNEGDDAIIPLAVDPTITNSAYVLKRLNGRLALYRIKLDGSMATGLSMETSGWTSTTSSEPVTARACHRCYLC